MAGALAALGRRSRAGLVSAARALGPGLVVVVAWRLGWPRALDAGAALRARHRWAVTELAFDGRTRTLLWGPAPPLAAASPVAGAPNGVHLDLSPIGPTRVRLVVGQGPLPPGDYELAIRVDVDRGPASLEIRGARARGEATIVDPGTPARSTTHIAHPGGPVTLEADATGTVPGRLWLSEAALSTSR